MNDKKNREFNGLNTQKLNTVFASMRNHPGLEILRLASLA
jgi:hypothetical protein